MTVAYIDTATEDLEARPGKGPIPSTYAIVGIAPSTKRPASRDNEPFGSKSWELLQRIRGEVDETIYATNLIKTPIAPGVSPKMAQMREHYPGLLYELMIVQPKRILALGAQVAKWLCPDFKDLREDHGTIFYNPDLECYVVPTYHFSAAARNPALNAILGRDLERFFELPDPVPTPSKVITSLSQVEWPRYTEFYIDIETTGFDALFDEITSIGFSFNKDITNETFIFPNPDKASIKRLYDIVRLQDLTVVGHNLAFDLFFLWQKSGFFWDVPVEDTMVLAYLYGEMSLSLKHLASFYTDSPGSRAFGSFDSFDYLSEDVSCTRELYQIFSEKLGSVFIRDLANELVKDLIGMRSRGVYIDRDMLQTIKKVYEDKRDLLEERLQALLRNGAEELINLESSHQLVEAFKQRGVPLTRRTPGGSYSLAEDVLEELSGAHEEAALTLEYRGLNKTLNTFIDAYLKQTNNSDPYLRPRLFITSTRTGRLSCRDPNLQQVPRLGPVKTVFSSRWGDKEGSIGLIDFSQAELRVFAILSGDERFAEMLMAGDAHRQIASILFKKQLEDVTPAERKKSKGVTFGLLYQGGERSLAARTGTSVVEVRQILNDFFNAFPQASRFIKELKQLGLQQGYIESLFGRRRELATLLAVEGTHRVERVSVNTPVQGLASDLNLIVLHHVTGYVRKKKLKSRPFMAVHDSSLLELWNTELRLVAEGVQQGFEKILDSPLGDMPLAKKVPFTGELIIGKSWAHVESTAEDYYDPDIIFPMNSLQKEDWSELLS